MNMPPEPEDPELLARMREGFASVAADLGSLLRYQGFGGSPADRDAASAWLGRRALVPCAGAHLRRAGRACRDGRHFQPARQGRRSRPLRGDHLSRRARDRRAARSSTGRRRDGRRRRHPRGAGRGDPRLRAEGDLSQSDPAEPDDDHDSRAPPRRDLRDRAASTACRSSRTTPTASSRPTAPRRSPRIAPDICWHIAGLAKCIGAGLRLAYVVAPDARSAWSFNSAMRALCVMASPITAARRDALDRGRHRRHDPALHPRREHGARAHRARRCCEPGAYLLRSAELQSVAADAQRLDALGVRQPDALDADSASSPATPSPPRPAARGGARGPRRAGHAHRRSNGGWNSSPTLWTAKPTQTPCERAVVCVSFRSSERARLSGGALT